MSLENELREHREVMIRGKEGMAVFLKALTAAAATMQSDYDRCDFGTQEGLIKAIRIQAFRDIVTKEIPRIMENCMNVDREPENKWSFWKWLKK